MDTLCEITLYGNDRKYLDDVFEIIEKYDNLFNANNQTSEIYKLNKSTESEIEVSKETAELIEITLNFKEISSDAYNPLIYNLSKLWNYAEQTIPSKEEIEIELEKINQSNMLVLGNKIIKEGSPAFDPGSSAKGYISDKICEYLEGKGVKSAIINLGGNIRFIGDKNGKPFKALLKSPFNSTKKIYLSLSETNISTCGTYERYFEYKSKIYHHILDTKTGFPIENGLVSATVIGPDGANTDILSTVCFVLGKEAGLKLIEETEGYEVIFINKNEEIFLSSGLIEKSGTISLK